MFVERCKRCTSRVRVKIETNFVIPGLETDCLEIRKGETIRSLLKEISGLSRKRVAFFEDGQILLEQEGCEVALNGLSYAIYKAGLDLPLMNGDVVTIKLRRPVEGQHN
jgi:hypothetical protein